MDKKRILFVIPTLTNGGAERAMSNITTHLPVNVEADLLVNSISEEDYPTDANILSLGMKPVINKSIGYQVVVAIRRIRMLRQLKKRGNYDACISLMDSANICNILTGNRYCKVIVSVRVYLSNTRNQVYKHIVIPLVKLLYNRADNVVAVSKGIGDDLIHHYGIKRNKVSVITNGYDVPKIREECISKRLKEETAVFTYIAMGRYNYQKGQWHLIRAFRRVIDVVGGNVQLIILGQGEMKEYLQTIIRGNNLESNVTLMPYSTKPFEFLSQCDAFVMPSLFEGYSNALCEALICGLPCVACDFKTSAREILAPETDYKYQMMEGVEKVKYGYLVPVCSGKLYEGNEPLEAAELCLAEAMIRCYEERERVIESISDYTSYDIKEKVYQYVNLV